MVDCLLRREQNINKQLKAKQQQMTKQKNKVAPNGLKLTSVPLHRSLIT